MFDLRSRTSKSPGVWASRVPGGVDLHRLDV